MTFLLYSRSLCHSRRTREGERQTPGDAGTKVPAESHWHGARVQGLTRGTFGRPQQAELAGSGGPGEAKVLIGPDRKSLVSSVKEGEAGRVEGRRRCPMRILVTYGSTRGGTQGLAEMVAGDLRGRPRPDAKGFPASAIAKKRSGDWRDDGQVRQWTRTITSQLRG
jgi:hypothetical protein